MSAATGARVALRERTGLEAADLGFAMVRAWWKPLAATWLAFVLPAGCVIVWLLRDSPVWSIALLWWLRPAFARIPLHVLSLELFGERATLAGTARALPALLRSGLFASLVTRRLSPTRTFLQPVLQLEGLRGAARSARAAVLARKETGAAAAAATVIAHLNGAFISGLLLFAQLATPSEIDWSVLSVVSGDSAVPGVLPALYLAGISVFEPLLVACGFGLYVNRRVYLEGWEIELAFRRLSARAERSARVRRFAAAAATALALWLAVPPAHASGCIPDDAETSAACVREILDAPDFGKQTTELRWMPKTFEREDDPDAWDLAWLAPIAAFFAESARILLYVALAVGIAALLFALRGVRPGVQRDSAPPPRTFLGLDLDPASLPEDIAGTARSLWQSGDRIGALSLLYRGALVKLGARGALEIPESATEFECVRAVRRTQPEAVASAFGALTGSWIRTRYAHAPPTDVEFLDLCARFAQLDAPS
jgi:hypothetical protein